MFFYRQRWAHYLFIACIATAVAMGLHLARWQWAEALDDAFRDGYFRLRGAVPPAVIAERLPSTRDIVIVETNRPLPRRLLAKLITHLRLAKVLALDFMLVDEARELRLDEVALFRDYLPRWRDDDRVLGAAIRAANNVVLGAWVEEERVPSPRAGQYRVRRVWEKPPPVLWQSARYRAHLFMPPDARDGVVRTVPLFADTPRPTPCLGLAIAAAASGLSPRAVSRLAVRDGELRLNGRRIPVRPDGSLLIDFLGGRESFNYGSNHIVYSRVFGYAPEDFRGKVVIVGESSIKSKEIALTPFGGMPGMQLHAHVAATLRSPAGPPRSLPLAITALLALAVALVPAWPLLRRPLWSSFVAAAALVLLIALAGAWLFAAGHVVLPASVPLLALILALNGLALYEYGRARETLGRFIGREMVPQTLHTLSRLHLGGREEEASAFFCDLRNFMALAEGMPSHAVSGLINEYTSTLVEIVRRHGGRPIDYQGDGVFVLFEQSRAGAPHGLRAVRAALEFHSAFVPLRRRWVAAGWPLLDIGIGIASGPMMIGLVGAEEHLKMGAVGDIVNVAARIQTLNFQCGYAILLTRAVCEQVAGEVEVRSCGHCIVHGRRQPVEVFGVAAAKMEGAAAGDAAAGDAAGAGAMQGDCTASHELQ
jgi:class 3 adenylate cyclase/CHASE2 domain-containing sensor protein